MRPNTEELAEQLDKLLADDTPIDECASLLFSEFGIRTISDGAYEVPSSDGKRFYTVTFRGRDGLHDGSAFQWHCSCPAGTYARDCKHAELVHEARLDINRVFGYE